jgi:hypothetical protein
MGEHWAICSAMQEGSVLAERQSSFILVTFKQHLGENNCASERLIVLSQGRAFRPNDIKDFIAGVVTVEMISGCQTMRRCY